MIDKIVAQGLVPDPVIRYGINNLLKKRLKEIGANNIDHREVQRKKVIDYLNSSPIAVHTDLANDQHYMVPPEFFEQCLGHRLKYSSCYFHEGDTLDQAEDRMLELTVQRAAIKDGDRVLELGCGWGSLTLFMAEKFPNSEIHAVSNSSQQRESILKKAESRGLKNVNIHTSDVQEFTPEGTFDRIVSVEMFEHMRNYSKLFDNISSWLNPEGTLFVHIFVHRDTPYLFEVVDDSDWMSKYFFSGGTMPSEHLFYYFQERLQVQNHWVVNGVHYAKTAREWLNNMDRRKDKIMDIFNKHYGKQEAKKWFNYWRVFYMSCEELWRFNNGSEWYVSHYLFNKK